VDSPGGTVSGLGLAAEAVRRARDKKRVIAVIDDMACSAAYWIACQAGEVVVPDGGIVGSIGIVATHMDYSKMLATEGVKPTVLRSADLKGLGSPVEPLSGKALESLKAEVQRYHDQFVLEVSRGRKVSLAKAGEWATGETWLGVEAVKLGLADRIGSMSTVLEELQAGPDEGDDPNDEEDAPEEVTVLLDPDDGSDDEDNPDLDARATQENASVLEQDGPIAAVLDAPSAQQTDAPDSSPSSPVPKGETMNLQAILAKVRSGLILSAEEATFLEARVTTPEAAVAPDPLASLPPEARRMLEDANARATRAEDAANAERAIRLTAHFGARSSELGLEATMGPVLMRASSAMSKEDYESLEQSYRAKAEQDKTAALFATKGHTQAAPGTAKAEVQALVQTAMEGNAQLDFITAQTQVLAANPALASRLMSEQASQN